MILTPTVRYILLAVFVLFSGKTKCLSNNVKNDAGVSKITAVNTKYESLTPILKGNDGDWKSDLKAGNINSETLNSNEAQVNFLRDDTKKKCWTSLCVLLQKHRVIRQTNPGQTSLYPHLPTSYPYHPPNNAYSYNYNNPQSNSFSNATNPYYPSYSTYPQPNVSVSPSYQRQPTNPPYHNNYTNNFNPSYSPNVRHTYPPSPKPDFNRPYQNNTGNSSYFYRPTHNQYSSNSTYQPTQFYSNTSNSNYPNSFQNHGSAYPPYNQRQPVNQTFGYKGNYTNFYGANSTPLNNSFSQRTPYYNSVNASYAPYPNNNNQGSIYSPNRPYTNNSEQNHYNPPGYYPTSANTHLNASGYLVNPYLNRPTTYNGTNVTSYPYYQPAPNNNPSPYNANIPQYNPSSQPNNFNTNFNTSGYLVNPFLNRPTTYNGTNVTSYPYYQPAPNNTPNPYNANIPQYNPSYNNGPQYDPHKNTPQHFSYPPY